MSWSCPVWKSRFRTSFVSIGTKGGAATSKASVARVAAQLILMTVQDGGSDYHDTPKHLAHDDGFLPLLSIASSHRIDAGELFLFLSGYPIRTTRPFASFKDNIIVPIDNGWFKELTTILLPRQWNMHAHKVRLLLDNRNVLFGIFFPVHRTLHPRTGH
ncbi:hypothetical protein MPSEU_000615600 [Mayamaea pseudoterrestris]|nr:hypothetical protein MPSEU_000615600 [Mayamaea pseudoterrestris]